MDKERTRASLMAIAGGYLVYQGVTLISDVIEGKPENSIIFIICGAVFVVAGIYVLITKIKAILKMQQEEALAAQEALEEEDSEDASGEEAKEIIDTDTDAFEREVERFIDQVEENKKEN